MLNSTEQGIYNQGLYTKLYLKDPVLLQLKTKEESCFKVGVHTIWCIFGQFKFVQKDHFQRNINQSYISIWRVFVLQYIQAII